MWVGVAAPAAAQSYSLRLAMRSEPSGLVSVMEVPAPQAGVPRRWADLRFTLPPGSREVRFDILAQGHGRWGTKADATAFREYLDDLYAAVLAGMRAGKSLDALKAGIRLPKYASWGMHGKWLTLNVEGVYNRIRMHRRGG